MYLLLCGMPPFIGHTEKEIMGKILNDPLVFKGTYDITKMEYGKKEVLNQKPF